jgi:hypothetical protein
MPLSHANITPQQRRTEYLTGEICNIRANCMIDGTLLSAALRAWINTLHPLSHSDRQALVNAIRDCDVIVDPPAGPRLDPASAALRASAQVRVQNRAHNQQQQQANDLQQRDEQTGMNNAQYAQDDQAPSNPHIAQLAAANSATMDRMQMQQDQITHLMRANQGAAAS